MTTNNTKGHGYFRKKKWAKGLVSGIALAGAVAFSTGAVLADEVTSPSSGTETTTVATQPESINENNAYAEQANTSTGAQTVTVDNSAVEMAVQTATETGVVVTKEATVDQGTDTNSTDLDASKATIKADQEKQIKEIKAATQTQAENNVVYSEAQGAIDANNNFVEDAKVKHEKETTVNVVTDQSTSTDGSAIKNKQSKEIAERILKENQDKVATYELKKSVYDAILSKSKELKESVDSAAIELKNKGVTVTTSTQAVYSAADVEVLQAQNNTYISKANSEKAAVDALLAQYAADLATFSKGTNVSVSAEVRTQDVDNLSYGHSFMNGTVNVDGTFTFVHDMNDGLNDTYGTLGVGELKGKLNYRVVSQGNGDVKIDLDSVELYSYSYTSYRSNFAANQNLNFHVYTLGGTEIYGTAHSGNSSFTDTINRSTTLNYEHSVSVGDTLAVGFLNIDDNWIYNTHGQAVISFTNTNKAPDPVNPPEVKVNLVTAVNSEKPTLELTKLADTKNQQVSVAYHDYKLSYKPMVTKSVSDTDQTDTNGDTVVKDTPQVYTLSHSNIYANINNGDTITIVDPLEAGATPDKDMTQSANEVKGWTVNYDDSSSTYTFTAIYQGNQLEAPIIIWSPSYDKGFYDNTYKVFTNDYEVFSNTVTNYTPEPPKPSKTITDNSGVDIDGATTFDRNVTFHLTTDYSPYTKVTASKEAIAKGFAILDDVQDGAFTVDEASIKATATDGTDVKDIFNMYHVFSDEARTEAIQTILDNANLSPVGEFYLWVAKDPASFYSNYVKQAKNITINLPSHLLVSDGEVVSNDFDQIDFGNSYQSNLVTVQVPDVKPEKHALDDKDDNKVLDGQEVQIGDYIRYLLDGVTVPVKHDTLWQYDGKDKLDTVHDRYTGNWKGIIKGTEYPAKKDLVLTYDVILEDGTLIEAGDIIKAGSKYAFTLEFDQDTNSDFIKKIVTVTWDESKGEWSYSIDEDFLYSLGVEGMFDVDFYIEVERIASGDVENTFVNIANGKEMTAKVTTHTHESPQPPKPTPSAPNTPVKQANMLPFTGEASSALTVLGGFLLSSLGLVGIRKRKEN